MVNNNINTLTFDNHDTYIYYLDEILKSDQLVKLTPINQEDTDTDTYTSKEANLYTNGVKKGVVIPNTFNRFELNPNMTISSTLGTIITSDGILMFNIATEPNSGGLTNNDILLKSLAIYKSGKYANYINVEIQINFENGYRILTISY